MKAKNKDLPIKDLASALGLGISTVRKYVEKGMQPSSKDGNAYLYNLEECKSWQLENISSVGNRKTVIDPDDNEINLTRLKIKEEALLKQVQRRIKDLQYAELSGRLVSASDAITLFQKEISLLNSRLEELPKKLSALLYTETDRKKCEAIIKLEIDNARLALVSEYRTSRELARELKKATDYDDDNENID